MAVTVSTQPALRKRAAAAPKVVDAVMRVFIWLNGALAIVVVALIFLFLLRDTLPVFKTISYWNLLRGRIWDPLDDTFGVLPLILVSLWVTVSATAIVVPRG